MSATDYMADVAIRHSVFIQRYAGGQSAVAKKQLRRLRQLIVGRINAEPTDFQLSRLKPLLNELNELAAVTFGELRSNAVREMVDFIEDEAQFTKQMFDSATKSGVNFILPSSDQLIAAVNFAKMDSPIGGRLSIDEVFQDFGIKKTKQIIQMINDGVLLGDTTPKIARNITNTLDNVAAAQLEAIVRTATNHTSSLARSELYSRNTSLLDGYIWLSTLDGRTTLVCAGRDRKSYPVSAGIYPPAHWQCRSTTIPKVNPSFSLANLHGTRPAVGAVLDHVSGRTTYGGWLRTQPKAFQDEALGKTKAQLFRKGKMKIGQFTDPTGREYTIAELRATNPLAFSAAGL